MYILDELQARLVKRLCPSMFTLYIDIHTYIYTKKKIINKNVP